MSGNDYVVQISPDRDSTASDQYAYQEKHAVTSSAKEIDMDDAPRPTLAGRRRTSDKLAPPKVKNNYDGESDEVNSVGHLYNMIVSFNGPIRYLIYILPVSVLIAIPLVLFATIYKDLSIGTWGVLGLMIWFQVSWASVWITKVIAQLLPFGFQWICGFVSSGTRKYRLILEKLEIPISLFFATIVGFATFKPLTTLYPHCKDSELTPITQDNTGECLVKEGSWVDVWSTVLIASICVSAALLVEKLVIQLISINYHRRQFHARVKESKDKVAMLDTLYEASVAVFPAYCKEFLDEDYVILTGVKRPKDAAGSNLKIIGGIGMAGEAAQRGLAAIASEITGARNLDPGAAHNMVIEALEMKTSSEALGRRIWLSLVSEGEPALLRKDILEILGEARTDRANEIFDLLDADANGDVSLEEMSMMVADIARERKDIARSMHDVGQAVKVLDRFLSLCLLVIIAMIYAAFFSQDFAKYLLTLGSQIAAVSFAISATVQEFLGSCIFLFVKHPYDVGDRVVINDVELIVEHISLLYTVFHRVGSNRVLQISNIKNNDNVIDNVSRSKAMKEQITMSVHADTPFADIEQLKAELEDFMSHNDNKRDFHNQVDIELVGVKDLKALDLTVSVLHKSNWSNEPLRQARRNKLLSALIATVRSVGIHPPGSDKPISILPSYDSATRATMRQNVAADVATMKEMREPAAAVTINLPDEVFADNGEHSFSTGADTINAAAASLGRRSVEGRRPSNTQASLWAPGNVGRRRAD